MLKYGQLDCHGSVEFGVALSKKWRRHSEQRAEEACPFPSFKEAGTTSSLIQRIATASYGGTNKVVRDLEQRQ